MLEVRCEYIHVLRGHGEELGRVHRYGGFGGRRECLLAAFWDAGSVHSSEGCRMRGVVLSSPICLRLIQHKDENQHSVTKLTRLTISASTHHFYIRTGTRKGFRDGRTIYV